MQKNMFLSLYLKRLIPTVLLSIFSTAFWSQLPMYSDIEQVKLSLYQDDFLPVTFHQNRRNELRKLMPQNSLVVFFSNPVRTRSNDVNFEFHQDPNFYYLTGLREPNAILVIFSEPQKVNDNYTNEILYVQKKDAEKEIWDGTKIGVEKARETLSIQTVLPSDEFSLLKLDFTKFKLISYSAPNEGLKDDPYSKDDMYNLKRQWEGKLFDATEQQIKTMEYNKWMAQLREIKTQEELNLLKRAIEITCVAQTELMKTLKPEMSEFQSEAIVEFIFKLLGAESPGFSSIQGSGENSCTLHYQTNRKRMVIGDLLVSDIGAEVRGYTADVTRTLPVSGTFSTEQTILYNIVLEAQNAGIAAAKVGNNFWEPNIAATTILSQRLLGLGIIKSPSELKRYFMHGTSHYLGLDVHDLGTYGTLRPNSVITVEPGIYIPNGSPCDKKWWNIGIRIEDDILITTSGPVNLSGCVPRTISEIEALMKTKSTIINEIPSPLTK